MMFVNPTVSCDVICEKFQGKHCHGSCEISTKFLPGNMISHLSKQ
jgi:hypothetical protein